MSDQPLVFIGYSRKDNKWRERLEKHLTALQLENRLAIWSDDRIAPGDEWSKEIEAALGHARLAIVLVSADYLASDFVRRQEVPRLLQRRREEGLRITPVIVKPCPWDKVGWLSGLQARPRNGRALSRLTTAIADEELANIAKDTLALLQQLRPEDTDAQKQVNHVVEAREGTSTVETAAVGRTATWGAGESTAKPPGWRTQATSVGESEQNVSVTPPTPMARAPAEEFLSAAVSSGVITPLLGPGCADAPENRARGREHIQRKCNLLWFALQQELELAEATACGDYVEAIVADNFGELNAAPKLIMAGEPTSGIDASIVRLQVLLARVGAHAVRAGSLSRRRRIAADPDRWRAKAGQLTWLLQDAANVSREIGDAYRPAMKDKGLGAHGIAQSLRVLAGHFRNGPPKPAELEWLRALLWHLLRYDAPMYPRTNELCAQIALCGKTYRPEQAPTSAIAATVEEDQLVELIRSWFKRHSLMRGTSDVPLPFHGTLAKALCLHAPVGASRVSDGSGTRRASSHSTTGQFVPVAMSCNFDLELESALEGLGRSFHVVFPVRVRYVRGPTETRWILRTTAIEQGRRAGVRDLALDDFVLGGHLAVLRGTFVGPLIVKLHGSPLDELPGLSTFATESARRVMKNVSEVHHRFVLSDYAARMDESAFPPGLLELLRAAPGRAVCVFGFSPRDPERLIPALRALKTPRGVLLQQDPADESDALFLTKELKEGPAHHYSAGLGEVTNLIHVALLHRVQNEEAARPPT